MLFFYFFYAFTVSLLSMLSVSYWLDVLLPDQLGKNPYSHYKYIYLFLIKDFNFFFPIFIIYTYIQNNET